MVVVSPARVYLLDFFRSGIQFNVYFDRWYVKYILQFQSRVLDLHLSISYDIVSTIIYDKPDDFDFEIVNFPFLDGDVPCSTSYWFYISHSFVLLEHLAMLMTSTLMDKR